VIRRKLLLVVALAIVLAACSAQAGTLIASMPTGTSTNPVTSPVAVTTATRIPTATETFAPPALPAAATPALIRIDFQDAKNGWGIAANGHGMVLRTLDGGSSWLDATPPGAGDLGLSAVLTVLDGNHAWLLVPGTDFFSGMLYRTGDGGMTWSSNTVPFGGTFIQFQDGSHGFALADRGAGAGSEAVELFQTTDGGATWSSIFHDDPGQPGASDSLPLAGIKNGMTFRDARTGWVTGSIPQEGQVYLYVTQDGGVTWSQQNIPLPAGYTAYQYLTQAPAFFGKEAFLPVTIYLPGRPVLTFYTSQDGGLSWNGDPANAGETIPAGLVAIADAQHIWCWDGGARIYFTSNGAQTWSDSPASLDLSGVLGRLEFVPGFTGWALTRLDNAGHSQLYRTSDGIHWEPLLIH
jgi:photosystem II stability/assembly factor-like uncharacterized protein